jgi:hypothetical protein
MLANAINTTKEGQVPAIPRLPEPERPVRTYAHEVVLRLPDDEALSAQKALGDFGNRAAKVIIELDTLPPEERDAEARTRILEILNEACARAPDAPAPARA